MQFDVGTIHTGKVTGITGYGAFVTFPENRSGMLHISEISDKFIKDINEYLRIGDEIKVMIINVDERGKLALSVKRLHEGGMELSENQTSDAEPTPEKKVGARKESRKKSAEIPKFDNPPAEYISEKKVSTNFEDMMAKFKHDSDEKISDLKKAYDSKRGSAPKQRKKY